MSRCRHLTLGGARCTYPTLNDKPFCYNPEHRRARVRSSRPPIHLHPDDVAAPLVTFVYMDDMPSVMENVNAIAWAFTNSRIDHRQVSCLTYLVNTAIKTLDRIHKEPPIAEDEMPQDVVYDDLNNPMAPPDPAPDPEPAESQEEVLVTLNAAAEEPQASVQAPRPQPAQARGNAPKPPAKAPIPPRMNNLPPAPAATALFSNTSGLRPSATNPFSYTCHDKGVHPQR